MRFLLLALFVEAMAACGGSTLNPTTDGGTGSIGDSGTTTMDAELTCTGTAPSCTGCCDEPIAPQCSAAGWECPLLGCPVGICNNADAGGTTCSGPEPSCTGCCDEPIAPQCSGAGWTCPFLGCPVGICDKVDAGG